MSRICVMVVLTALIFAGMASAIHVTERLGPCMVNFSSSAVDRINVMPVHHTENFIGMPYDEYRMGILSNVSTLGIVMVGHRYEPKEWDFEYESGYFENVSRLDGFTTETYPRTIDGHPGFLAVRTRLDKENKRQINYVFRYHLDNQTRLTLSSTMGWDNTLDLLKSLHAVKVV